MLPFSDCFVCRKSNEQVTFDHRLQLQPYCLDDDNDAENASYRLYGVVVHHGKTLTSGHYVAYTRTEQGWRHFSDTLHKAVSDDVVLQQQAYLLFYERMY